MKKILLLLLILQIVCGTVFAAEVPDDYYEDFNQKKSGVVLDGQGRMVIGDTDAFEKTTEEIEQEMKEEKDKYINVDAVKRMEDMIGKVDHYRGDPSSTNATNCAWTIAWAYKGTPYGQDATEDSAEKGQDAGWTGRITMVGQLMKIAHERNQLITDLDTSKLRWMSNNDLDDASYDGFGLKGEKGPFHNLIKEYKPQPGDIGVERSSKYHFAHVYMVRAKSDGTLGTIESGGHGTGRTPGRGGVHDNGGAGVRVDTTTAWIRASDYANGLGSGFFKALYGFGKEFAWLMERFAQICEETIANLQPYMIPLFWLMAIIDLSMSIVLAGFEISPMSFIVRMMKYGFFYYVIIQWPMLVDDFFLSFATDIPSSTSMITPTVSYHVTNPHLLLQKSMMLLKPGLDYVNSLSWAQMVPRLIPCLSVYIISFIAVMCMLLFTVYIMISYIEFYVVTALSLVTLPYVASNFTKWIPQASLAAVWKRVVRLMTIAMVVGFFGMMFSQMDPAQVVLALAEKGMVQDESHFRTVFDILMGNASLFDAIIVYMTIAVKIVAIAIGGMLITDSVSGKLSGPSSVSF